MVSKKKINELVKKHAFVFKALEKFEKTGKTIIKTRINFTIDKEAARKFKEYCKKHSYNTSLEIENYMKKRVK